MLRRGGSGTGRERVALVALLFRRQHGEVVSIQTLYQGAVQPEDRREQPVREHAQAVVPTVYEG